MNKRFVCAIVISAIVAFSAISAFSEDTQAPAKDDKVLSKVTQAPVVQAAEGSPAEISTKTNELSIYGEVQAVNAPASTMSVQYYDYDNDEEKTLEVALDKDSKLENVKTIGEVKKGDWVDVTYTVIGGKNTAKVVSVEVEEPAAENNAPIDTTEE